MLTNSINGSVLHSASVADGRLHAVPHDCLIFRFTFAATLLRHADVVVRHDLVPLQIQYCYFTINMHANMFMLLPDIVLLR